MAPLKELTAQARAVQHLQEAIKLLRGSNRASLQGVLDAILSADAKGTFTHLHLTRLKPGKRASDPQHPGLMFRKGADGEVTFTYRTEDPTTGKQVLLQLGSTPAMGLAESRDAWRALRQQRLTGAMPVAAAKEVQIKVATLIETFLRDYVDRVKRPSSAATDRRLLEKHLLPALGSKPAMAIMPADAEAVLRPVVERGALREAEKITVVAKTMWNVGVKGSRKVDLGAKRWLPPSTVNPWGLVPTPRAVPVTHIPRAKDELRRFVRAVAALGPAGDVLMLQALTGCRIGEIVAAKPEHIDKEARTFTVPAAVAKNGEAHRVHLSDAAWEIVERRLGGRWLFPSVTEASLPLRADAAITLMAKVRASAKLPTGFGTHASRRAMATWVAEHGATKDLRDRMLNHVDRGSVDSRYARAALDGPSREQWDAWGRFLTGLLADNVVHLDEARA